MTRRATRGEPSPLVQIPVWGGDAPLEAAEDTSPDGVEELLSGLNPEQRRAVTHGDGPLLVVAGAGTGKTQVITRRIAWLIATRRAKPSEILALTFTDQAADEMQVRVDQLVPYGYTDTAISTFHAFGDRLVREFALELGLPPDVRVLSRPETVVFLRERLFELELNEYRPLGDPTRFLDALATLFSRAKDEDVSPDAYLAYADRLAAQASRGDRGRGGRIPTRRPRLRRTRGARASSPVPTGATRRCSPRTGRSTSATRSRSRCGCCATRPRLARPSSAGSSTSSSTSSRTRTGRRRELVALVAERASQRDGRRRRRPVDLQVPRRRHQQHPRVPRALPRRRGSSCCGATTGRGRRSSTRPTASSGTTSRTAWSRAPGSSSASTRSVAATTPCPSATRRSRAVPRRRTGSLRTSPAGSARARGRGTSPSWSARTPPPTRSCGR